MPFEILFHDLKPFHLVPRFFNSYGVRTAIETVHRWNRPVELWTILKKKSRFSVVYSQIFTPNLSLNESKNIKLLLFYNSIRSIPCNM